MDNWSLTDFYNNNYITTCNGVSVVGGYMSAGNKATLSRKFTDLPSHYKIRIVANVFFLDTWDSEYFYVRADNVIKDS